MPAEKLLAEWFWTDRWMGSSAFLLPLEARGLYRELLTQAWRRGARLPNDHEALRRAAGVTPKEWGRAWPLIERYWRVEGDSLVNDTQLEVYADAQARTEKAAQRGQRGAQKRWSKTQPTAVDVEPDGSIRASPQQCSSNAQASAQAMPKHLLKQWPPSPSPSPIVVPSEPQKTTNRGGGGHAPLWRYPRFAVFRWMVDDLEAMLGPEYATFDLDAWFQHLSDQAEAARVVIGDPWKFIKAETLAEATRRGLAIAVVVPVRDSLSSRMASAIANIKREENGT